MIQPLPRLFSGFCHCHMREAEDHHDSLNAALKENPGNAAITPTYEAEPAYSTDEPASRQPRLMVAFTKYWARGRTLRIAFLNNPPMTLTRPIIDAAKQWLPYINLKFEFISEGHSDIRIAFNAQLNSSELGTDALLVAQDKPTMEFNLRDLYNEDLTPRPELPRVVLHEFGHALGAVHEHQHPAAGIPWNVPLLTALLGQAGYSETLIRRNFLDTYEAADFMYTPYDRDSIMHFDIPNALTLGDFEVINVGKTLSRDDIRLMNFIYPKRENDKFGGH